MQDEGQSKRLLQRPLRLQHGGFQVAWAMTEHFQGEAFVQIIFMPSGKWVVVVVVLFLLHWLLESPCTVSLLTVNQLVLQELVMDQIRFGCLNQSGHILSLALSVPSGGNVGRFWQGCQHEWTHRDKCVNYLHRGSFLPCSGMFLNIRVETF